MIIHVVDHHFVASKGMHSCRSRLDQTQPPTSAMPATLTAPAAPPSKASAASTDGGDAGRTVVLDLRHLVRRGQGLSGANGGGQPDRLRSQSLTTRARAWFDEQYVALGTSSAMLDGQVAVDFSGQTRATLLRDYG